LSAAEVQSIYAAGVAGKCEPPPVVATQPQSQAVFTGATVDFSVQAVGTQPLSYQWQFNGTNISAALNPTATTATLVLNNVQTGQAGNYSVSVSNSGGATQSADALLSVLTPGSCFPPPADIVSWWGAEGTAADYETNNPGMLEGGASYAAGEVGQAFDFRNGTGYVQVPDSPSLALGANDFTIELWVDFSTLNAGQAFIAKDDGVGQANKWLFWLNNGQLQFYVGNGDAQGSFGSGSFHPVLNTWYHLAVTRSGSLLSFYVDGVLSSTAPYNGAIPAISAPLTIGEAENGFFMGGLEDEVTLYSRALGAAEIQNIYTAGSGGKCIPQVPPTLVLQPLNQTAFAGANVTFAAQATGTLPLAYQWQFNGTNISAATNATATTDTLVLNDVQTGQTGTYSVLVSNSAGSTNSAAAQLTVRAPGSCNLPSGAVSWWTADGNTLDSVGNNNGALEGGAGFVPGEVGLAFDFRNGSGYVQAPDSPSLALGANDFTIELWANFASLSGSRALLAKDNGSGQLSKWIFWLNSGQLQFYVGNGSSQTSFGSGAFSPALNTWHHLAVTRSGSLFSFYVDGALSSTATYAGAIPAISAPLTIGQAENGYFMGGLEDEVTLYSRALLPAEIQDIYLEGSAGKCGPPFAPVITTQPQGQTLYTGQSASFAVTVVGYPPLAYQWQMNGTNIPAAVNATATTATLVLNSVQTAAAGNYSVMVSSPGGSTNSAVAALAVVSPGSCLPPPAGVISWWGAEGNAADYETNNPGTLEGGATFAPGEVGLAFDFRNGSGYVQAPDSPSLALGANDFTIELWADFTVLSGSQALIAKDDGSSQPNKWIFWLNNGQLQFYVGNGSSQTSIGSGVFSPALNTWHHLAVTRSGSLFSFYVDGVLSSTATYAGAIPAIAGPLTIGQTEGKYFMGGLEDEVTIYNQALGAGEIQAIYLADSTGKCAPPAPPFVTQQPQSQTVFAGAAVSFSVQASGTQPLNYQWQLNGTNISAGTNPTAATATLVLPDVQTGQSGNYSVLVSNAAGSTNSAGAQLSVRAPGSCFVPSGVVSWWTAEGDALDSSGTNNGLMEGGAGFSPGEVGLAFDFSNGSGYVQVPDSPSLALGSNDFTIELWAEFTSLSGSQALIAKDSGSGQLNKWIFWVSSGQLQLYLGNGSSQGAIGSGAFSPALNTWHHLAVTRSGSLFSFYVDGALNSTATYSQAIPAISAPLTIGQSEGKYFMGGLEDEVTLYSRALSLSEIDSIYLEGSSGKCGAPVAPVILTPPQSQTLYAGGSANFSVAAVGTYPLAYQWQLNGTNIPSATNTLLAITNLQSGQSGNNYSVTVSNPGGSTNSGNALLTVLSPGSCFPPPANLVSWWNAEGSAADVENSNPGTLQGGAGFAPGEVGQAFDFRNGSGYVQVPDSATLALGANDFTIELWANFTSLSGSQSLIAKDSGSGQANKWIFWVSNGQLQLYLGNGSSQGAIGTGTFNPALNTWHHLAVTRSGSLFSFYADGVLISTATYSAAIPAISAPLTIGQSEGNYFMGGLEDEVALYSRALSASEIQTIFTAGSAGKCGPLVAPVVLVQPQSQTVFTGANVSLSVQASGSPPLAYQWRMNGTNISAPNSALLVLNNVQPGQSGNYSVTISNPEGSTNSAAAVLTVNTAVCVTPPAGIVSWWEGEGNAADSAGTNAGTLQGGAGFAAGKVGAAFAFTNGTGYVQVPDSPGLALGAGDFTIELWANFASLGGSRVLIAKDVGPGANNKWVFWLAGGQLQMFVQAGSSSFSVGSGAFNPALNTWHHLAVTRSGSLFSFYVDGVLSSTGANSTPLPIDGAPLTIGEAEGTYFMGGLEDEVAIYSRALGAGEIQAIYNADSAGKCGPPIAPVVLSQPRSQLVLSGQNASFYALIAGSQPLSYQWEFNGTNIPAASNPTATSATLLLSGVEAAQSGSYSVIASNGAGTTNSAAALLTVYPAGSCFPAPSSAVGWWAGEGNALDSAGTNHGSLVNGVGFAAGEVGQAFNFNGTNQYVDVPSRASLNPTNSLTLEAWVNPGQFSSSAPAIIKKAGEGSVTTHGYTLEFASSSTVVFGVYVNGAWASTAPAPILVNQWNHVAGAYDGTNVSVYVNGVLVGTPLHAPGVITPSGNDLQIGHDPSSPSRYYKGLIDEPTVYSSALSSAQILSIYFAGSAGKCPLPVAPSIAVQPQSVQVVLGSSASFSVLAGGSQPLGYQWQFNQSNILASANPTANNAVLVLNNAQTANAGNYSVIVTNQYGSASSTGAALGLLIPPVITLEPLSQSVQLGCDVTFSSAAIGTATLAYQWQKNGTNLPGQNAASLVLLNVQPADFGNYAMIAGDSYGLATSAVAVLSMDHVPVPGGIVIQRFPGGGVRMDTGSILAAATDADGDPLSLVSVAPTSVAGGTVTWSGFSIYYYPPAGSVDPDAFNYTISDGHCNGTAVGTVLVDVRSDTNPASQVTIVQAGDGTVQVIFDGMPGVTYRVQSTDSLTEPDWQDVDTLTAGQYGTYIYVDRPSLNGPARFFRSVSP
jgi:hypothetical protein